MEKQTRNTNKSTDRRSFIKRVWAVLGLVAGAELLWVSSGFLKPGRNELADKDSKIIVAGKVGDFNPGDVFPFRNGQFYLVRYKNGGFMAISLKCSHLGCSVLWNQSEDSFQCPCHASSFDIYGDVVNPPAPKALDIYPVIIEEGLVKVNISKPIPRRTFDQTQITYA